MNGIGGNIKYYRKANNLTLKQLGETVGYAENSVWQWEKDMREPNIQTLLLLAKSLGITIIELLGGKQMQNGQFTINGKDYSLYEEMKAYDNTLSQWKIEEYLTFKLRVIKWCEENGFRYEHSTGRELVLIPILNGDWGEEAGILLEVPEQGHFDDKEQYDASPLAFFSLGNEEEGYRVVENIDLSIYVLEEMIRKYRLNLIK